MQEETGTEAKKAEMEKEMGVLITNEEFKYMQQFADFNAMGKLQVLAALRDKQLHKQEEIIAHTVESLCAVIKLFGYNITAS